MTPVTEGICGAIRTRLLCISATKETISNLSSISKPPLLGHVSKIASRKVIVWGSSYSACLVFVLAAKHPGEIAGLLSFSPAEYFQNKSLVHDAAVKVNIPVFITSAKDNEEEESARSIFDVTADEKDRVLFVPRTAGVHGSSTLREDRNPDGAAENWSAVLAFLKQY